MEFGDDLIDRRPATGVTWIKGDWRAAAYCVSTQESATDEPLLVPK
jgi:hypothetical protein